MRQAISSQLRAFVTENAQYRCEYCCIHQSDLEYTFHVDHIISLKHGGGTDFENLALSCSVCNQNKGTDLGTYLSGGEQLVRLFHPRRDKWEKHFEQDNGEIIPLTDIGAATIKVLDLNNPDRIILRRLLVQAGRYP
jgi:5-methylcytosine-specific restriction endonuclease McrA